MKPIPPRLAAYLDFIHAETLTHGRPPSLREMGSHFGRSSTNGTWENMMRLRSLGLVLANNGRRTTALPGPPTVMACRRCGHRVKHYAVESPRDWCVVPFRVFVPILHDCN